MSKVKLSNPVARALILRKGGPHVKSKAYQKMNTQKAIKKALEEWKAEGK